MSNVQHPDDATLVAWLDGELSPEDANHVATQVSTNKDLGERVRLLRSARTELTWALGESASAPPPAPLAQPPVRAHYGKWLLVAAAIAIVLTIGTWRPDDQIEADENDLLAIKVTSPRAAWDLFSNIRFALEGQAKTNVPCRIMARQTDETDAQLAARAIAENNGKPIVPMVLSANLSIDKRDIPGTVASVDGTFGKTPTSVDVGLVDVRVRYDGIGPLLTFELNDTGGREDFMWPFRKKVRPQADAELGFVPTEIGEYRLTLQLRALATEPGKAAAFVEPLEVAIGFAVGGIVGKWSKPFDGMSARIIASRKMTGGQPLGVAVQLRNDSERARKYNVAGTTMANIPQPFHFDVIVDGNKWQQRKGLGLITTARSLFVSQPVGTTRSVIVLADYWHDPKSPELQLEGKHQISIRFDYAPSAWESNDKGFWIGVLDTPPITITFAK